MSADPLLMYVVYWNPSDYPRKYVVRRWYVQGDVMMDLTPLKVSRTLDGARAVLPPGLTNLGRYSDDDPAIWEVWL